jgi:hypothetical protein
MRSVTYHQTLAQAPNMYDLTACMDVDGTQVEISVERFGQIARHSEIMAFLERVADGLARRGPPGRRRPLADCQR